MGQKKKKPETPDDFASRLRNLRAQRNLSQEELGEIAGLHYNHIGKYERGLTKPTVEKLKALASALGVSSDYLISGSKEDFAQAHFDDRELLAMFQEIEKFPDDDKLMVKKFLDALITKKKLQEMAK